MASTFTSILRLELQATGENEDTWGTKFNEVFHKLETAISGRKSIALTASDVTLTTNDGGDGDDEQAAAMILDLSGAVTADVDVIAPNKAKLYVVHNGCTVSSGSVNIRTASGSVLEIPEGDTLLVWCDGSDNFAAVNAPLSTQSGSFTATQTGVTGSTTATVSWIKVEGRVYLLFGSGMLGTPSGTTMTITGIPSALRPAATRMVMFVAKNGGSAPFDEVPARGSVSSGGVITCAAYDPDTNQYEENGFSVVGSPSSRGVPAGTELSYAL